MNTVYLGVQVNCKHIPKAHTSITHDSTIWVSCAYPPDVWPEGVIHPVEKIPYKPVWHLRLGITRQAKKLWDKVKL